MFTTYDYMPSFWHLQRATYVRNRNNTLIDQKCRVCKQHEESMAHVARCIDIRTTFWKNIINTLNDIQGSNLKVNDALLVFTMDREGKILKRNQRGFIRLAWRIMNAHFTRVDTDNIPFNGKKATKEVLSNLYERILAAGEEVRLRAARRRGTDTKIGPNKILGESYSLAPFATLDSKRGTMVVN